jgi:hypothetical protein
VRNHMWGKLLKKTWKNSPDQCLERHTVFLDKNIQHKAGGVGQAVRAPV